MPVNIKKDLRNRRKQIFFYSLYLMHLYRITVSCREEAGGGDSSADFFAYES